MKISTIDTGFFKLDGGAMFGVVPKRLWQRMNEPDGNNMCTWAMRCLLIESGDRKILVDTGIGDKQDDRFRKHFEPHGIETLNRSIAQNGLSAEEITDVFLTHLHFDHCGGAVKKDDQGNLLPAFPNATYWTNEVHFNWAMEPNAREKASFLMENFVPLKEAGVLRFIDVQKEALEWMGGVKVHFLYGHTEAMMMLELGAESEKMYYCADLIPSSFHVGMPYVMAYDVRPLMTMEEKGFILSKALDEDAQLIFEHDPKVGMAGLRKDDRGRIVLK